MKVAVLGGGPAGLYFAISMKLRDSSHEVTVVERNKPDDTFGWGVVLSAETLDNLTRNDPVSAVWIKRYFAYWDDIAVIYKGVRTRLDRPRLLRHRPQAAADALQRRARELGIKLVFETEVPDPRPYMETHDLVVAADGLNSRSRSTFAEVFKPDIDTRKCKFVWLGTHQKFDDAFTFIFEKTEHGWVWAHAYQFDKDTATFIVECSEETWERFGFGEMTQQESIATCERIFEKHLGGHELMTNANHIRGSAWINFPRVLCERWSHKNLALMGDAAARAHFSIGSGTKLALESAVALADYVHSEPDLEAAFQQIRGRAAHRGAEAAVGGAQFARMVRGGRALSRPRSGAVQLFAADALAAHQPREFAAARPRMAGRRRGMVPARRPARARKPEARADVRAVPAARDAARRTASSSRRWRNTRRSTAARPTGISPTMPSAPRAARGWSISR